jgi:hypothetical protein
MRRTEINKRRTSLEEQLVAKLVPRVALVQVQRPALPVALGPPAEQASQAGKEIVPAAEEQNLEVPEREPQQNQAAELEQERNPAAAVEQQRSKLEVPEREQNPAAVVELQRNRPAEPERNPAAEEALTKLAVKKFHQAVAVVPLAEVADLRPKPPAVAVAAAWEAEVMEVEAAAAVVEAVVAAVAVAADARDEQISNGTKPCEIEIKHYEVTKNFSACFSDRYVRGGGICIAGRARK